MTTAGAPGSNEQTIGDWLYAFFRSKGFSPAQARIAEAGGLGNLQEESNFNPRAFNPREGAKGIAQWEGGRGPSGGLGNYAAAHGLSIDSLAADLGYLGQELNGPYAQAVNAERTAGTASAAAIDWATFFEHNDPVTNPQRAANASAIYAQLAAGHPLTGGPSTSAGDATLLASVSPLPKPPFGSSIKNGPLTAAKRSGIIAWIVKISSGNKADTARLNKLSDAKLISLYNKDVKLYKVKSDPGGVLKTPPVTPPGTGLVGDIASEVAAGVETVIKDVAAPFVKFLINALLVVAGLVGIVIALVLVAHSDDGSSPAPAAPAGGAAEDAAAA